MKVIVTLPSSSLGPLYSSSMAGVRMGSRGESQWPQPPWGVAGYWAQGERKMEGKGPAPQLGPFPAHSSCSGQLC